jgi:hypothetical protein
MASPALHLFAPLELRRHAETDSGGRAGAGADLGVTSRRANYLASITVSRESSADVGFREIFVSVDGESLAVLQWGESVTHELPAGPHRIRAHNTLFWKTHDVVLQPGEHARFTAINRAGFGTFGFMVFLGASPVYLTFERDQHGHHHQERPEIL